MTEEKKPEVRKVEDLKVFEIFKYLGLHPKKIDPKYRKYVGLNARMMASTIDTLVAIVIIAPLIGYFIHTRDVSLEEISNIVNQVNVRIIIIELIKLYIDSGKMAEFMAQILMLLIFSAICWKFWSATPGKILFRMKIVDAETEKPMTNKQIILRALGYIPACAIFFLGIFWISFNKRRQGWHDKMAGTVVIYPAKKKVEDDVVSDVVVEKSAEIATQVS